MFSLFLLKLPYVWNINSQIHDPVPVFGRRIAELDTYFYISLAKKLQKKIILKHECITAPEEYSSREELIYNTTSHTQHLYQISRGARWLSGRVSDSGARGPGFETYLRRVVSLSKTLYSPKVLVNYPGSDGSVPT